MLNNNLLLLLKWSLKTEPMFIFSSGHTKFQRISAQACFSYQNNSNKSLHSLYKLQNICFILFAFEKPILLDTNDIILTSFEYNIIACHTVTR